MGPLIPFFERLGYRFIFLAEGRGSGGLAAQGEFRRGSCFLRLHVRQTLGIVEYGFDDTLDPLPVHHDVLARLGVEKQAAFPGFGDDLSNFTHLLADLQRFLLPLLTDPKEMARVLAMPTPQRRSRLP
ncbi:MAG: hypothetical protein WCC48_05105 [Anaeromyxobacteraceae bacterium]